MPDNPPIIPPPSSILRLKSVMKRTGLTRPTLYRKIAEGTFPRQVRISVGCIGWREAEVDAWLHAPMEYRASDIAAMPLE